MQSDTDANSEPGKMQRMPVGVQGGQVRKLKQCKRQRLLLVFIGLVLLIFVYKSSLGSRGPGNVKYAVVIDAGSTGSRVHVYKFEKDGAGPPKVVNEVFKQLKPGLSSFADNPKDGALSLKPLLDVAESGIPDELHEETGVFVGATAGLRLLPGGKAEELLHAVKSFLNSPAYDFSFQPQEDVKILSGRDEGKYAWIATNVLLGKLTEAAKETYGVIDLGGGSVQIMLQTPEAAPPSVKTTVDIGGNSKLDLFVHSFLGYGLMAARMKVLKQAGALNKCMPEGAQGSYEYGKDAVNFKAANKAGNFQGCLSRAIMVLNLNKGCGQTSRCSFDGQWAGAKAERFFLLSYLYERIYDAGAGSFDESGGIGISSTQRIKDSARKVCSLSVSALSAERSEIKLYDASQLQYLCLDLTYIYAFLSIGVGIGGEVSLAKKFVVDGKEYEAAWSLGAALETIE